METTFLALVSHIDWIDMKTCNAVILKEIFSAFGVVVAAIIAKEKCFVARQACFFRESWIAITVLSSSRRLR